MNDSGLMAASVAQHSGLHWGVVAVFAVVYLGMFLGGLPRLKLDRAGVALLGAIAVIGLGAVSVEAAARAVDLPTVLLLFAFMVMSAQMRLGGFYTATVRWVGGQSLSPAAFMAALIAVAASFTFPSSLTLASTSADLSPPGGIAEVRVVGEAQRFVEGHRGLEVGHGQVDEDHLRHGRLS